MSNVNTQWRITVAADTARARSELKKFAKTAQVAGMSMEEIFSNVEGAPVARTFKGMGRELNRMNSMVQKSKVHMGQWNRYWKHSNNLIRHSKQLQTANTIAIERTNGAMTSATAVMQRFNRVTVSTTERLAYMNTFFRAASVQAINAAKNIQWAGRQITVGFGVPFGIAMAGASMAFFKFEEQLVRFRKVFNDEVNEMSIEEAEERITSLANTMATKLGVARDEVMETSALFAQMGYQVEEIERLTKATTELAMLGETDAQEAGKLLRAYSASGFVDTFIAEGGSREEFEDYIKDMLNAIENNTGLSIASMVEAGMAQLIPLFSQMGVGAGIGESILAGMTEALGGRTSEAVTALKAIMQRVYDESAETTEQFGFLGVDIQALQEKYKSDFVGLVEELGRILANNPAIQENNKAVAETFGNLFGVRQANRAIAGLRAVSRAYDESGEAVNDYGRALDSIEDRQANAARSARELQAQAESIGGQFKRVKEAIIIEAAEIGETFLEMVMPLVKWVRDAIEWFGNLSTRVKEMSMGFGLLVLGVGGLLTTVGVLTQALLFMARTIGFFLPKFKSWTEENVKQRIATDHVNEALREQRATVSSIVPLWQSIEQAMRESTQATMAQATAMERLNNVSKRSAGWTNTKQGAWNPHMGKRGMWADPNTGRVMSDDQAYMRGFGYGPTREHYTPKTSTPVQHSIGAAPSISGDPKAKSPVRWRGGAMAGGALLSMGGMFAKGAAGQTMFAAGMGLETAALLGPKVKETMKGIAERMAVASTKGNSFMRGLKASGGLAAHMLSTFTGMGIVVGAVAASAFLIKKRMEDAKIAANELRNEFTYAADVAAELGLEIGDSVVTLEGGLSAEELEESSDSMKSLVADVRNMRPGDDVQRIFRNMARQWLAGGATIEEINTKLNELEAKVGVEIDEVDTENLVKQLESDIRQALENSFAMPLNITMPYNLERFLLGDNIWSDPFGQEGTAAIESAAETFANGMSQALSLEDPERTNTMLSSMTNLVQEEIEKSSNPAVAQKEYIAALSRALGIGEEMIGTFQTLDEVTNYYYASIIQNQDRMNLMTETQVENLTRLADSSGYEVLSREAVSAMDSVQRLGDDVLRYTQGVYQDVYDRYGADSELAQALTGDLTELSGILAQNTSILSGFIDRLIEAKNASSNPKEIETLTMAISLLNDELDRMSMNREINRLRALSERFGYDTRMYDDDDTPKSRDSGLWDKLQESNGASEAGESDAKSYVGALRSELDQRRDDFINHILEMFDDASEARMEALENERDRRIEILEEQRDDDIEAIEDARDAEIEAIDERKEAIDDYIDKQKELQEAMQDQIDLAVALASGERGKAAQIQNAMRFGTIEDMAESEKERLDEEKDRIKETYDNQLERQKEYHDQRIKDEKELYERRIDAEKDLREEQKERLEENLDGLRDMFLGSVKDWEAFERRATGVAADSGVKVTESIGDGFVKAMEAVKREMDLDAMWDNADFPNLKRALAQSAGEGIAEGIGIGFRIGANDVINATKNIIGMIEDANPADRTHLQRIIDNNIRPLAEQIGGDTSKRVSDAVDNSSIGISSSSGSTSVGGGFMTYRHSGGPIGSGAPKDVPAILQTGEYVIQRKAAQALGPDVLDKINKFHVGGSVGTGAAFGDVMANTIMGPLLDSMGMMTQAMEPNQFGGRTWGKAAPNTVAAQQFINQAFSGVRGAYTSVDRGDPRSDHSWGKALDVMTSRLGTYSDEDEKETGWQVANFFRSNPDVFGTKYIIWQGMISNGSVGNWKWRPYDRMSGPTGGHYDHVHLSFLHGGGEAGKDGRLGLFKGGRLKANNVPATLHRGETVLRAPVAKSLEEGIANMAAPSGSGGGLTIQIDNFHGTDENIDRLASKVGDIMDRHHRKVNPKRSFS